MSSIDIQRREKPRTIAQICITGTIIFYLCFVIVTGVMIGRQIVFKKLASSGKQIIGITFANCKCKLDTCTVEIRLFFPLQAWSAGRL